MARARDFDTGALIFGGGLCLVAYVVTGLIIHRPDWPLVQFGACILAGMTIFVVSGAMWALVPSVPMDSRDPHRVGATLVFVCLTLIFTVAAGAGMSTYWHDQGHASIHGQNHKRALAVENPESRSAMAVVRSC